MSENLFNELKIYLDITWEDEATNRKLNGIMERGKKYINGVAGLELDFDVDDKPKELLFDYCRYVRSNALNEFQNNYLSELLTLQMREDIKRYEATITDNTDV